MTIDPSVHIQPMVLIHQSKIGSPAHFSKWRKARKYSLIIGCAKYDGSITILSVMLTTDSIDPSVKNFSFLTDSIDHRFEKKIFSR
jgi:hypothetical protein